MGVGGLLPRRVDPAVDHAPRRNGNSALPSDGAAKASARRPRANVKPVWPGFRRSRGTTQGGLRGNQGGGKRAGSPEPERAQGHGPCAGVRQRLFVRRGTSSGGQAPSTGLAGPPVALVAGLQNSTLPGSQATTNHGPGVTWGSPPICPNQF